MHSLFHYPLILSLLAQTTVAWLPGQHRDLISPLTSRNLFKRGTTNVSPRWLPSSTGNSHNKIRGVDLGSLFVFEPWMASDVWSNDIGCDPNEQKSEFDCVNHLGQDQANTVFQSHWGSWVTQDDFQTMADYGLNTVRIPVGYWMYEDIVYDSEHFPQGGLSYLLQVCDWARQQGFYIIIDLHGAPYSQSSGPNADTGQFRDPGFYDSEDAYNRSYTFLAWMATQIHTSPQLANVGMLEILNEPIQDTSKTGSMLSEFYPGAWNAICDAESKLGVSDDNALHVQMMNELWGSGDPTQSLPSTTFAAYDDHRYLKWAGVPDSQDSYISTSCSDNRGGNSPTIVGEWSLSTNNNEWDPGDNQDFYKNWWAAQVMAYEKQEGWIFWSWKTSGLNDPRWDYQMAVSSGIISSNPDDAYNQGVCS